MSETKWTPGPWVAKSSVSKSYTDRCKVNVNDCLGYHVAKVSWPTGEIAKANAQLVAAAPELYEALERLLPMAEDDCFQYGNIADEDEDIIFARAAIAKARGEA